MGTVTPVIHDASSDSRKAASFAVSAGTPRRFSG
jgi:hypothetical protein